MKKFGLIAAVLVALVAVLYVIGSVSKNAEEEAARARVGDCASVSEADGKRPYERIDCSADHANVKIATIEPQGARCPSGGAPYSTFTTDVVLCLIPNFVEGSCYGQDERAGIVKVSCDAPRSVRITRAVTGTAEDGVCGKDRKVVFPKPVLTFCLAENGG
ncbi:LppU/SCO3897 family protein [Umezawaea beigongshangensis]|uniref:LppU/SCO3897 family protein n=1 Tax=Umezawaea beigongshangensis TaxID=2780383 RepID=UPI0018F1654B|nr:hypothetical protein [Umezawaea beigongshangensis]